MRERLVVTEDSAGLPTAKVPFTCMWELVEYLSYQRIAVSYQYHASDFTVTFTRIDLPTAQQILSSWSNLLSPDRQVA